MKPETTREIGPVQLLAVHFGDVTKFEGKIVRELKALRKNGTIRLLDLLFVAKDSNGRLTTFSHSDLNAAEVAEYGHIIGRMIGLEGAANTGPVVADTLMLVEMNFGLSMSDVQEVANQVEPGQALGIMLFEHTWATGLKKAIRGAGGVPIAQGFLTQEVLFMAGQELQAIVESMATIEAATVAKNVAVLDALLTIAEAEEIKEEAIAEAEATIIVGELVKTAVAVDVLRTLIAAELIEEAALESAVNALVTASLIETNALSQAEAVVEKAFAAAEADAVCIDQMAHGGR